MKVNISSGNTKLGRTKNVSLPPIVTCAPDVPCKADCYAMKAYRMYPNVKKNWDENWEMYQKFPADFFGQINDSIKRSKSCKLFRWHVAGDIPDMDYLCGMVTVAKANPKVSFLAFTKRFNFVKEFAAFGKIPSNLNIVLSMWPGYKVPKGLEAFPKAWMRDPCQPDKRIPETAQECPSACETCGLCWEMKGKSSVVFAKH